MREIKFRAFYSPDVENNKNGKMVYSTSHKYNDGYALGIWMQDALVFGPNSVQIMQYTGQKDKNGKEIYEGDIFRVEESGDQQDRIYYLVIVWVQEWCMFCTLTTGEYQDYLATGLKALDEPMFWTYTLKDTNDKRFFLCGNIYQNRNLLKSK